jgi:hypothetical protein
MRTSARTIGQGARASFIHQEMTWQERSRPQFEASTGACHARTLCAPYLFEGRCPLAGNNRRSSDGGSIRPRSVEGALYPGRPPGKGL